MEEPLFPDLYDWHGCEAEAKEVAQEKVFRLLGSGHRIAWRDDI